MITKRKYPWIAKQDWTNVLFLHWPISVPLMESLIPRPFIVDTFDEKAWISIVLFKVQNSRPRGIPKQLSYPEIIQINVRTYVKLPSSPERGVYFFRLYGKSLLATMGARSGYGLPFQYMQTEMKKENDMTHVFGNMDNRTIFAARYRPSKAYIHTKLTSFLAERYCIWNIKKKKIIKIPILHTLWDLTQVNVEITQNELLPFAAQSSDNLFAFFHSYKQAKLFPYEVYGKVK